MEWVETTGKSLEEAKDAALDQLGVDEGDAEFEVVAEPSSSLFGLKKSDARVRARVRPTAPRAKEQPRRKRRDSKGGNDKAGKPRSESSPAAPKDDATPAEKKPARSKPSNRPPKQVTEKSEGAPVDNEVALEDQGKTATEFLSGFFKEAGVEADIKVSIDETDENVNVAVNGDNLGHLIGPRGNALHALQELTRTAVFRSTGARNGRILLDISSYREKRKDALERFSKQVAQEVIEQQVTKSLEPMHPSDRKIVHDTINEIDGVETTSEGEEPRRRVVIFPAGV